MHTLPTVCPKDPAPSKKKERKKKERGGKGAVVATTAGLKCARMGGREREGERGGEMEGGREGENRGGRGGGGSTSVSTSMGNVNLRQLYPLPPL